ncbi:DUF29 domain-containing protein [Aphanothece sacrum]|uniref:DUF29 domain-containing protein n=1 Tax=Aphanothece sacrum FPU1 TaxID=1920663 RepID=A0A401IEA9_APHSA|nr:DUF29 domain-containing protein [Aphanothece sacrum]GBF79618.1 hypothetical protein AsFPU1_1016 [Aphanothece sacrum FPU1]GBF87078.1 hypothetical protein AsFPU3_4159 [Aphanothece sacrum FPU3]
MTVSLYESDFLLWTTDTVTKLKAHNFEQLDLENLIEEIESLGRSQKKELKSRLLVILEHLLKRLYVNSPDNYRGWEITINEQRRQLELEIEDSPRLKTIWEDSFNTVWRLALKGVRKDYPQVTFPDVWSYPNDIESILDCDFWQ